MSMLRPSDFVEFKKVWGLEPADGAALLSAHSMPDLRRLATALRIPWSFPRTSLEYEAGGVCIEACSGMSRETLVSEILKAVYELQGTQD